MNISLKKLLLAVLVLLNVLSVAALATTNAQEFARGYISSDIGLKPAMVVMLSATGQSDQPQVERASRERIDKIIGVTTNSSDNLVTLADGSQQVYVQTSGVTEVFASDLNGDIKKDDSLTISPLKGIVMRADNNHPVVGSALQNFSDSQAETQVVTGQNGEQSTLIAKITMNITSSLPPEKAVEAGDSFLKSLGRAVVRKQVSEIQVIAAIIIFLIVLVTEGSIIYGAVSSGIISLGRNPLARDYIRGELIRVLLIAVMVLAIGLAAVYLVLKV